MRVLETAGYVLTTGVRYLPATAVRPTGDSGNCAWQLAGWEVQRWAQKEASARSACAERGGKGVLLPESRGGRVAAGEPGREALARRRMETNHVWQLKQAYEALFDWTRRLSLLLRSKRRQKSSTPMLW